MEIPGLPEGFVPAAEASRLEKGRYEEIKQPLIDLGYLTPDKSEGKQTYSDDLSAPIAAFRRDYRLANLLKNHFHWAQSYGDDEDELLDSVEVKLLHRLVSLDGEFPFSNVRLKGRTTLYTRVLRFRLELLGLLSGHPGEAFDDTAQKALAQLALWAALPEKETIRLTADFQSLTTRLLEQPLFEDRIVYFSYFHPTASKYYELSDASETRFRAFLRKKTDKKSGFFQDFKDKVDKRTHKIDFSYLARMSSSEEGAFLFRLLQVRQWMNGLYDGELPEGLPQIDFEELLAFAKMEFQAGRGDFKLQQVTAHIARGYWAFNIQYFFEKILEQQRQEKGDEADFFEEYEQVLNNQAPEERAKLEKSIDEYWQEANQETQAHLKSAKNTIKRAYFGVKSVVKSIGKRIGQVFKWMVEKVKDAFAIIKNMVKLVFRELREALRMFRDGMSFLFGRRMVQTIDPRTRRIMLTDFDFDFDCSVVIPSNASPQLIQTHHERCLYYIQSMRSSLILVAYVLKWIFNASSPIGWTGFAFKLVRLFKGLIGDLLSKKRPSILPF